ncbi:GTPase ERA-like, chloroplastic isoform X2 [Vigna angularis]|uniref:GTPase ERA-like, chloroplastic isoform X2 n=1 Tax=Phaseolus angularis TaxID=3914 RepID=UPI0022B598BC|nr:GTPase ERA-like, chloroplastic isoform X2 [Vigna angularis]
MEKLASSTATVPTQHFLFQLQHSLFPVCTFATSHRNRTESLSHLSSRTRHRRFQSFHSKQDQLWVGEEELQLQLKEAVEDEGDSYLDDDDSSFLSLSDKPDRNMALLDDYETEELDFDTGPDHRSGYVALLGKPNVGKSTLANQMLGQKLSIVTDKPQTTRHRILCICSGTDYQMILYDTPGVLQKEMHMLDSMMMKNVRSAAVNADCVLVLVDARKAPEKWYEKFTDVDEVIPVSAKYGQGVEDVKDWILSKIPNGPAYYPKDIVSEHPERFFVAEIVREKIFIQYRNEIPYACQVNVVNYKARPNAKDYIQVEILVEKNSQKIIIIGKEGKALKLLAMAARLDVEDFLQKKVYLEIEVKVRENWRQDEGLLKHYGYGGQIRVI